MNRNYIVDKQGCDISFTGEAAELHHHPQVTTKRRSSSFFGSTARGLYALPLPPNLWIRRESRAPAGKQKMNRLQETPHPTLHCCLYVIDRGVQDVYPPSNAELEETREEDRERKTATRPLGTPSTALSFMEARQAHISSCFRQCVTTCVGRTDRSIVSIVSYVASIGPLTVMRGVSSEAV